MYCVSAAYSGVIFLKGNKLLCYSVTYWQGTVLLPVASSYLKRVGCLSTLDPSVNYKYTKLIYSNQNISSVLCFLLGRYMNLLAQGVRFLDHPSEPPNSPPHKLYMKCRCLILGSSLEPTSSRLDLVVSSSYLLMSLI